VSVQLHAHTPKSGTNPQKFLKNQLLGPGA
jgi:hypothetical protein